MYEKIQTLLDFLGWGKPHLLAMVFAFALSTVVAWVTKYPLRLHCDRKLYPLQAYKWMVRTLAGFGAQVGAWLTWPERGRMAFLGGILAWFVVLTLYKVSGPFIARFWPMISSDHYAKMKAVPDDDDQAGV